MLEDDNYSKDVLVKNDTEGMHEIYDRWPEIARENYESQDYEPVSCDGNDIEHIVFSGMGGSGAISDIFSSILSKSKVHVCVVKGYLLPKTVDSNTLVVTTSISGNTVETMTVLNTALEKKSNVVAFSNGGKMKEFCNKNDIVHRHVPMYHSPRASFTSFLYSMLKTLAPVLPISKADIKESLAELEKMRNQIGSSNLGAKILQNSKNKDKNLTQHDGTIKDNNPALDLASWINGIPIIYFPAGLQAAAIRFKNCMQENAKSHAIAEDVLEASHNGIVAWENKNQNVQPILLRGQDDYIKTKERWNIIKQYFEQCNIDYREIFSVKGSILSKLINLIYLLDYSTIYKATMLGIDPSPIMPINFVKEKL